MLLVRLMLVMVMVVSLMVVSDVRVAVVLLLVKVPVVELRLDVCEELECVRVCEVALRVELKVKLV